MIQNVPVVPVIDIDLPKPAGIVIFAADNPSDYLTVYTLDDLATVAWKYIQASGNSFLNLFGVVDTDGVKKIPIMFIRPHAKIIYKRVGEDAALALNTAVLTLCSTMTFSEVETFITKAELRVKNLEGIPVDR